MSCGSSKTLVKDRFVSSRKPRETMSTEILERDAACQAPHLPSSSWASGRFRLLTANSPASESVEFGRSWPRTRRTQRVCAWIRGCRKAQRDEFAKKLEREASIQECPAEAPACKREGSLRQPVLVAARIMNFPNVRRSMLRTPRLP